jgi:hypothetical protein
VHSQCCLLPLLGHTDLILDDFSIYIRMWTWFHMWSILYTNVLISSTEDNIRDEVGVKGLRTPRMYKF